MGAKCGIALEAAEVLQFGKFAFAMQRFTITEVLNYNRFAIGKGNHLNFSKRNESDKRYRLTVCSYHGTIANSLDEATCNESLKKAHKI